MIAFVLHAHLPWLRGPGDAIDLEESWFFEALWESYLPLLDVFEALAKTSPKAPVCTLSLSPTLLAMLADPDLGTRFGRFTRDLERAFDRARRDRPDLAAAIADHRTRLERSTTTFAAHGGNLPRAFVGLADAGVIELATTSATHAFLPGLRTREAVHAQIRLGMRYAQSITQRATRTFWLPECGYDERLEQTIGDSGIQATVLSAHGIQLARPRPPHGTFAPIVGAGPVAYFGRCNDLCERIWSPEHGYPSSAHYREFYAPLATDEPAARQIKPYRVSGRAAAKAPYDPTVASSRVVADASRFTTAAGEILARATTPSPVLVAAFDAELFGHWWWEGPAFLSAVLSELSAAGKATSLSAYLARDPMLACSHPATSTWGRGGYAEVWTHPASSLAARVVHRAERLVLAVDAHIRDNPRTETQRLARLFAIRELFLLQSSDYAFMLRTGEFAKYAERELRVHAEAVETLAAIATRNGELDTDRAVVKAFEDRPHVFRELDEDAWADTFDPW